MPATLVIKGANVITMKSPSDAGEIQTIAIEHDKILAVGSPHEIEPLINAATKTLNLSNKAILPGFIDTHVHFTQTGLGALGPSTYDITSSEGVLDIIADAAANVEKGKLLLVHGCAIGELDCPITRDVLDKIGSPISIVIGDIGGHACTMNSLAWQSLDLSLNTSGVMKDSATDSPTGIVFGKANSLARYYFYNQVEDSTRVRALQRAAEIANQHGITTVHALDGGTQDGHGWLPERDMDVLLSEQSNLSVRTTVYFQTTEVPKVLGRKLPRIGGCLYIDGAYGEHTAALMEPYADDPTTKGMLYFTDAELNKFVQEAHRAGLQISMHAIGDAAIEQLLNAYEHALRDDPRSDHRHRIEHFSLPSPQHIEKAARLGVAAAMQPNFAVMPDNPQADQQLAGAQFLGPDRFKRRHPYRKIMDAGILIGGGSDSDAKPMGPFVGIHALVNHPDEERRLTVFEALSLYTINAAKAAFDEKSKGTIEPGKFADFVVLNQNPLTATPGSLKDTCVEMTILGGKIVYERNKGGGIRGTS